MKNRTYHQGLYRVKNKHKYVGDLSRVVYRSSYELKFFKWLDFNENVITFSSEEMSIPYKSPKDGRWHRYYPDVKAELMTKNGIKTFLFEVKPDKFTRPPKTPKRKTKHHLYECIQYSINEAKWKYALDYCKKMGYEFKLITEKELAIKL
jgi:hypothetical protein